MSKWHIWVSTVWHKSLDTDVLSFVWMLLHPGRTIFLADFSRKIYNVFHFKSINCNLTWFTISCSYISQSNPKQFSIHCVISRKISKSNVRIRWNSNGIMGFFLSEDSSSRHEGRKDVCEFLVIMYWRRWKCGLIIHTKSASRRRGEEESIVDCIHLDWSTNQKPLSFKIIKIVKVSGVLKGLIILPGCLWLGAAAHPLTGNKRRIKNAVRIQHYGGREGIPLSRDIHRGREAFCLRSIVRVKFRIDRLWLGASDTCVITSKCYSVR